MWFFATNYIVDNFQVGQDGSGPLPSRKSKSTKPKRLPNSFMGSLDEVTTIYITFEEEISLCNSAM